MAEKTISQSSLMFLDKGQRWLYFPHRAECCKYRKLSTAAINNLEYIELEATEQYKYHGLSTAMCLKVWIQSFDQFVKVKSRSLWWHQFVYSTSYYLLPV